MGNYYFTAILHISHCFKNNGLISKLYKILVKLLSKLLLFARMKPKIIAFTGLPMTGKSTARETMQHILDTQGIPQTYVHFGSTEEVERRNAADEWSDEQRGLSMEQKERFVREQWRREHGMGAMAIVKLPEIEKEVNAGKIVLIDNLYSDEERQILVDEFGNDSLLMVATVADWTVRVQRGESRPYRPLSKDELEERDKAETYNLNKGPTIALARITIANNSNDHTELENELKKRVLPLVI